MTRFAWAAVGLAAATLAAAAAQPDPEPDPESGPLPTFLARSGASKGWALKREGGPSSEFTLAKALAWLARQQKSGGAWHFPDKEHSDPVGATSLSLLPFLGASQTHRSGGKYTKHISDALDFLTKQFDEKTGTFGPDTSPAGHALATAAVCEGYGLTRDAKLLPVAKAAVGHLAKLQRPDGGWAEEMGKESTLVGTGWAVFTLRAAVMARVEYPDGTARRLTVFLDSRVFGSLKQAYGEPTEKEARPGTTPTAIGLLTRHLFDGWGPNNIGLTEGTIGMFGRYQKDATLGVTKTDRSRAPKVFEQVKADRTPPDPLWAFYATRVVFAFGGPEWQEWNEGPTDDRGRRLGGMRDWLIGSQSTNGNDSGSWDAPPGFPWGRLGATAMHALTLEVYYRDPPLFPRPPAPDRPEKLPLLREGLR